MNTNISSYTKQSNELYSQYLQGNREEAKRSLQNMLTLVESSKLDAYGRANYLSSIYSRQYVYETKVGTEAAAQSYFNKAKEWELKALEAGNVPMPERTEAINGFTTEKCRERVEKWDREHNGGKDPTYTISSN